MKLTIGRIAAVVWTSAGVLCALSCASGPEPKKQEEWPDSKREDWEHQKADDPCMEKGGEPRKCTSNDDCCQGFTCGLDPSRSRVFRYCTEG